MAKSPSGVRAGLEPRAPSRRGPRLIEFVVILVAFAALMVWLVGAVPNRDLLWFSKSFDEQPSVIRVYRYGETREVRPGDPAYADLTRLLNQAVVGHTGYVESLYPHDQSLEHYQTRGYAIEAEYPHPVLVHTRQFFPPGVRLMVAIDGAFNYTHYPILFRATARGYQPGGLALDDISALREQADRLFTPASS